MRKHDQQVYEVITKGYNTHSGNVDINETIVRLNVGSISDPL